MNDRGPAASAASVLLWAVLALLVLGIVGLAVWKARPPAAVVPEEKAVAVRVMNIATSAIADVLVLPGRVAADRDITLSAEKGGLVAAVDADEGDAVTNGQAVVRLDARLSAAARDRAQVEKADAERELGRMTRLKSTGAVSDSDLDAAQSRFTLATVQCAEAAVHLDQCTIRSPVAGRVEERRVEPGERVGEGQAVMRVVVLDPLKVEMDVPERDIGCVGLGSVVPFAAARASGCAYTGRVSFIASQAHPASNTFRVELTVDGVRDVLRPGMVVDVHLPRGERSGVVVVPLHAVIPRKGDHIVFLVGEADRAVSRVVRIDRIIGSQAVLASGLAPGDRLVVEGQRMLQDGMRLHIADGE